MHGHMQQNKFKGGAGGLSRPPGSLRTFRSLRPLLPLAFAFESNFVAIEGRIRVSHAMLDDWLVDQEIARPACAAAAAYSTFVAISNMLRRRNVRTRYGTRRTYSYLTSIVIASTRIRINCLRGAPGTSSSISCIVIASTRNCIYCLRGAPGTSSGIITTNNCIGSPWGAPDSITGIGSNSASIRHTTSAISTQSVGREGRRGGGDG